MVTRQWCKLPPPCTHVQFPANKADTIYWSNDFLCLVTQPSPESFFLGGGVMFIKLSQSCINHPSVGCFVLYAVQEHVFYSWIHHKLYFRCLFRHNQLVQGPGEINTLYYNKMHLHLFPKIIYFFFVCVRKSALNDFVCEFAFPYR